MIPRRGTGITLREIGAWDLPRIVAWRNDPRINRNFFSTTRLTLRRQQRWFRAYRRDETKLHFTIRNGRRACGMVYLNDIDCARGTAEAGIFVAPDCQGRGHGARALRLLLACARMQLRLRRIALHLYADNHRARRLYRKLGFRRLRAAAPGSAPAGRPMITMVKRLSSAGGGR